MELRNVKIIYPLELEEFIKVTNDVMSEYDVTFRKVSSHLG